MAYRFNPPPNWPIEDPNWTPPPGWQPDPSWGPPPADWNFWVDAESPVDAAPEAGDNATHVATTGEQDQDAPAAVPVPEGGADAPVDSAPETAEYEGPNLEADLAQQTPYESGDQDFPYESGDQDLQQGQAQEPAIGQDEPAQDFSAGDAAGAAGGAAAVGTGAAVASGYGQASPNQGWSQASPGQGYGSPNSASTWTATTAPEDAPKKGVVARFWWVGCLVLLLIGLLIAGLAGGLLFLNRGGEDGPTGGATTTSASADPTEDPTEDPTATEPTSEEATTEEPTDETVTPSVLPTVDPAAEPVEVVSSDGRGTMQVSMEWLPADQLPSEWDGNVQEPEHGEYLVVTAKISVTEGEMYFNPFNFAVVTPYGGELSPDSETFALKDAGVGIDAPSDIKAGEEYTIRMLFTPKRAGGMQLEFDTYTDQYTWDIAE